MKRHIYLGLLAGLVSFSSCNVDLLDIPQQGVTSEETFYKTDEDCEEAIAAVYSAWRTAYSGGHSGAAQYANGFFLKNFLADDFNSGGSRSDQTYAQEIYESRIMPTNLWVEAYYKDLYSTVYLCNLVIGKFDPSESAIKARNVAEAKVYRALCYFELTTLWGNPPKVDRVLQNSDEYKVYNSTKEELWSFIETDLKDAIDSGALTSKTSLNDKDGCTRATLEAAKTILGKAYLYQGKYGDAKPLFKEVINTGLYDLEDDIDVLYHTAGNGSKEYVLECTRHFDMSNMYSQGGWYGILANWGFGYGFIAGTEADSHFKFNSTSGYSYYNPTKSLYDAFVAEEGEDGYRVTSWICPFDRVPSMNIGVNATNNRYGNEGYFRLKWLTSTDDENVSFWCGNQSCTPVIRYADVLLMMAECCIQTGDADADNYFNRVRTRAKLPSKSGITMDDLKLERRLELAMEAVRFQDLIRWGDAATVLKDKGKKLPTFQIVPDPDNDLTTAEGIYNAKYTTSVSYTDNEYELAGWTPNRDELLPYPENEIEVNPNIDQNPGYASSVE